MEFTRRYLPMEWEERWRREKERRKQVMEEGGTRFEEENRRLQWIKAYNDSRMGMKEREGTEKSRNGTTKRDKDQEKEKQGMSKCKRDAYPSKIFKALEEMRQRSVLTDLTLSVDSGLLLQAHALVLAAVSTIVQQMLQERDGKNKMFLGLSPEVSDLGLSAVLEFAYTGTITGLNRESLAQVRAAALSLGVPRVLELCREEEEERKRKRNGSKKMEEHRKISAVEQMEVSLWCIRQLWEEGVGCDVELEAEGQAFNAHKVFLTASSDYFHAMFSSGMRESRQASVSLLLIGAHELEALLHCCYSGTLDLDWDCVFELACRALQFQFQPALSLCLGFLRQHIDLHSCLDVVAFAEAYMISDLLEAAEDFFLVHFQEVAATPKFQDLPPEKLLDFLGRDGLCTPSELAVFRAAVTWIEKDPEERLPQAREVMAGVRFPLMTFREFREVRAVNLQMECSSEDDVDLYGSALKEFGFGGSCSKVQHRVRHPKDALVLVGGDQLHDGQRIPSRQLWFVNSLRNGTGLVKEIEWRILGEMPEQARFRHGVGVLDGKLYMAGGCHYYAKADTMRSAYRYDPLTNSWERLQDMLEKRSNFMMVVRGGSLYAIGGDRDLTINLDSVEKYSPESDAWSFVHPLDQPLSGHATTVLDDEIFISGGFNCKYQCLVSMLLYHPEQGTTYLADMAQDRALHCMETLANRFYVAGGSCNLRKFYTDQLACETYNPVTDSWAMFTPLPLSHVGAASAVLEEKVYVLGGYCQEDYSEARLVHRYDPVTQRWENMGKLAGPVTDLRACLLRLPAELRELKV
ncbi:kelch-like protein 33 [Salminus brasiliensis]|uniref:kelch-like protein 33 n=1 Tax=Salminus brasiliensis TaxID=930266 RepID=UPI003B838718